MLVLSNITDQKLKEETQNETDIVVIFDHQTFLFVWDEFEEEKGLYLSIKTGGRTIRTFVGTHPELTVNLLKETINQYA